MLQHRLIFAAMIFTLAACATATDVETADVDASETVDPRQGEEVSRLCFTNTISGFTHVTDRSVVVAKGTKDYLITTKHRCSDLKFANSLALRSTTSCLTRGDKFVTFSSTFGPSASDVPSIPCYVDKIYEWDDTVEEAPEAEDEAEEDA